jgi:hypothetical protein
MMFIQTFMLEPASASLAIYLITKTSSFTNGKNRRLLLKKPYFFKKKICKWILHNKNDLIDTAIDETNDYLLDLINHIYTIKSINPSVFMIIYVCILVIAILT